MASAFLSLTIPSGQALSAPIEIPPIQKIIRLGMPSVWSPACPITFSVSPDGVDWRDLFHVDRTTSGFYSPYETGILSVIPNSILSMPPGMGVGIGWLKVRSGTRSQPVNQDADRTFAIVLDSSP